VICPNCGENNSANFRFCGMCGTSLEQRRPAGAPRTVSTSDASRTVQPTLRSETFEARVPAQATVGAGRVPQSTGASSATAGPSFLGLNQPFIESSGSGSTSGTSPDESFSGLDSFFEQEESGVSGRGIILTVVLLLALGAGGWWAYQHYNGVRPASEANSQAGQTSGAAAGGAESADNSASSANPNAKQAEALSSSPSSASSPASSSTSPASASPNAGSPANAGAPANAASSQPAASTAESGNSTPPAVVEPKSDGNPPAPAKTAERTHSPESNRAARGQKVARADIKPASRPSAAVAVSGDKGDAEFKRGEAYLYGRGMPENCNEAIRNLKEASAKQNAKARSTFGTMYATGHCVPHDLPTAYSWFAQALRVDPNNQILSKDLTAVWNQMTPPERQMTARNR
jgi:hypothetical protein